MDIYKIKRLVYLSPIANNRFVHAFRFKRTLGYIRKVAERYGRGADFDSLLPLMKEAYVKYHWNSEEFFMWHFEKLTDAERREYIPEYDHNIFCLRVNNFETAKLFRDKWTTYQRFEKYFKRKCVYITSSADLAEEEVKTFLNKNKNFLAKPVGACCGQGIRKFANDELKEFYLLMESIDTQANRGGYLLESYIIQSPDMGVIHPASVNTIRIPTINYGDHIQLFHPYMRVGRHNSFVDNVAAGGIGALIDVETGTVMSSGDEYGNSFEKHPDTGVQLIGFKIPRWKEAVETVKKMASECPDVHYVGWDLALTDDGWVMIEGNEDGQFGFQYISPGVAKEVAEIYKKLKKNHQV